MWYEIQSRPLKSQIPGLDSLRGIAIMGVVGYHLFPGLLPGGFLGVNLFFVLSGYLIAITSRREQTRHGFRIKSFYFKRALRIYPSLLLTVCAVLTAARLFTPDILPGILAEILSIFSGTNNWWQIVKNTSYFTRIANASPFTHLWSLAIEMQFYLLWPLLFFGYKVLNRGKKYGKIFFGILIVTSILMLFMFFRPEEDPSRVYYGTDTRSFALLLGALLGMLQKPSKTKRSTRSLYYICFFLLCGIQAALFLFVDGQNPLTYRLILVPSTFLGAALINICRNRQLPLGRYLDCLPLSWLGRRSYEIYLIQYPVIFFIYRLQPFNFLLYNSILALVLILLLSQWLYWLSSNLRAKI